MLCASRAVVVPVFWFKPFWLEFEPFLISVLCCVAHLSLLLPAAWLECGTEHSAYLVFVFQVAPPVTHRDKTLRLVLPFVCLSRSFAFTTFQFFFVRDYFLAVV